MFLISSCANKEFSPFQAVACKWLFACDEGKEQKRNKKQNLPHILQNAQLILAKATIILSTDRLRVYSLHSMPFVSACGSERRNKNHFAFYRYWDCLTGVQFMPILNFELDYLINLHKLNVVGADIRRLCVVYSVGFCGAKSKMIDIDYLTLGLHNSSHLDQFSIYLLRNK